MDQRKGHDILDRLSRVDNLRVDAYNGGEIFIHEEHRWTAALIYYAQEIGRLPRPANLIMIDRHHDALPPSREFLRAARAVRGAGLEAEPVLDLIEYGFSEHDDDWITASMELGLIGDAAVIGGIGIFDHQAQVDFADHTGVRHHIELTGTIGTELGPYGRLGDPRAREEEERLWRILGWCYAPGAGFTFEPEGPRPAVTIDLDTFVIPWEGFRIPWPEEVFAQWFGENGTNPAGGVCGREFVRAVVGRSGVTTVAREAGHCGGGEKAAVVFDRVNRYLFDGKLTG